MLTTIGKAVIATVLILGFAYSWVGGAVEGPKRPRERKEGEKPTIEKRDKWTRGQRKKGFTKAVEGRVTEKRRLVERDPPARRGGRPVEKWEKWTKGELKADQLKKTFNDAAKARPPANPGRVDRGGGAPPAAPPAAPVPRPAAPRPR